MNVATDTVIVFKHYIGAKCRKYTLEAGEVMGNRQILAIQMSIEEI